VQALLAAFGSGRAHHGTVRRAQGRYRGDVKTIATGRINQVAAKLGDQAPMAATCCNACRTCVQTNMIALGLAAVVGAGAWVARLFGRPRPE
jgi:hypothetical protein